MPRGRKRKHVFIPMPWIPNSSSEDEPQEVRVRGDPPRQPVQVQQGPALNQHGKIFCDYVIYFYYC